MQNQTTTDTYSIRDKTSFWIEISREQEMKEKKDIRTQKLIKINNVKNK